MGTKKRVFSQHKKKSFLKKFTFDTAVDKDRWTPLHSIQTTVPWFNDTQVGSSAPQSAHLSSIVVNY